MCDSTSVTVYCKVSLGHPCWECIVWFIPLLFMGVYVCVCMCGRVCVCVCVC